MSIHKMYSEDALELDGILFEPTKKSKTAVIHIHGKEGHFIQNHFVTVLGQAFADAGIAFLTFNNRGHDYMADMIRKTHGGFEFVQRGSAYDILSESPRDINGVIEYVHTLGYTDIFLQGHSLGPHKICYYLSHEPKHTISGAILLSVSDIKYLFNAYVPEWKAARAIAQNLVQQEKGDELMDVRLWSNAIVSAKTFLDWTREDADSWIFNFSDSQPHFKYFSDLTLPILVVNPENDAAVTTSQEHNKTLMTKYTASRDFTFIEVPAATHGFSQKETQLAEIVVPWTKTHTRSTTL